MRTQVILFRLGIVYMYLSKFQVFMMRKWLGVIYFAHRLLVGSKLQIHLGFPEVQVSIIK